MRKVLVSVAVLSLFSFFSCREDEPETSEVESLDNFTGTRTVHFCKGSYETDPKYKQYIGPVKSAEQKDAVEAALSALPVRIKEELFFGGLATNIRLVDDVTKACVGSTMAQEFKSKDVLVSCHRVVDGKAIIYIDSRPAKIRQNLVRAIGFYFSEIHARVNPSLSRSDYVVVDPVDRPEVAKAKESVALALLDDVSRGPHGLKVFVGKVHKSVLKAKGREGRVEAWKKLTHPIDRAAKTLFANYALAEAFDSYFCNANTRQIMMKEFGQTAAMLGLTPGSKRQKFLGIFDFKTSGFGLVKTQSRKPVYTGPKQFNYDKGSYVYTHTGDQTGQHWFRWYDKETGTYTNHYAAQDPKTGKFQTYTGDISTRKTFFNPNTRESWTRSEIDQFAQHYGSDEFLKAAIYYDQDNKSYGGYANGGQWKATSDGKYQWFDASGKATGDYAAFSGGQWSYEKKPTQVGDSFVGYQNVAGGDRYVQGPDGNYYWTDATGAEAIRSGSGGTTAVYQAFKDQSGQWQVRENPNNPYAGQGLSPQDAQFFAEQSVPSGPIGGVNHADTATSTYTPPATMTVPDMGSGLPAGDAGGGIPGGGVPAGGVPGGGGGVPADGGGGSIPPGGGGGDIIFI